MRNVRHDLPGTDELSANTTSVMAHPDFQVVEVVDHWAIVDLAGKAIRTGLE